MDDHLDFSHWFGNIHFSDPCNTGCITVEYYYNNISIIPLNLDLFIDQCILRGINEINFTGTTTYHILHDSLPEIIEYIRERIPHAIIGIRTDGNIIDTRLSLFDKISISVITLDEKLYKKNIGYGKPSDIKKIITLMKDKKVKVNIIQCDEVPLIDTILTAMDLGIKYINIREPYGQPRIGNPFEDFDFLCAMAPLKFGPDLYGMPSVILDDTVSIVYCDIHGIHIKSVNLYTDGNIYSKYSVTMGHNKKHGKVLPQRNFRRVRHYQQSNYTKAF